MFTTTLRFTLKHSQPEGGTMDKSVAHLNIAVSD